MGSNNGLGKFETGHIGLNVRDLENSINFYKEVFGFESSPVSDYEGSSFAFLKKNGKLVLTLWQQSESEFSRKTSGLHHLSFQVETIEDVKQAEKKLKDLGADFYYDGIVLHGEGANSGGVFFEDPDGIRLEIFAAIGTGEYEAGKANAPSCGFF